jgi:hypothetical protein
MKAWTVFVVVLAACGDDVGRFVEVDPPMDPAEFCEGYYAARLSAVDRCCSAADRPLILDDTNRARMVSECTSGLGAALDGMTVELYRGNGRACIAAVQVEADARACTDDFLDWDGPLELIECIDAFFGWVPEGGACADSLECEGTIACVGNGASSGGVCTKSPGVDELCQGGPTLNPVSSTGLPPFGHPECAGGLECRATGQDASSWALRCVPLAGAEEACFGGCLDEEMECRFVCRVPGTEGQGCPCAPGFYCECITPGCDQGDDAQLACRAALPAGSPCESRVDDPCLGRCGDAGVCEEFCGSG